MQSIYERLYKPDVLSCLADLSNDEVFTPPNIANKMLDLLPQELFKNKKTKILDPACKSGVFLREAAKRFIEGERDQFDSLQDCIDWVFHNQIYGIAITELTSLLSRRSVYCSKYPNSPFSITKFEPDDVQGNILFHRISHTWTGVGDNKKCAFCGISYSGSLGAEARQGLETHAYEWIHTDKPEDIWNMKFDVVISNPPYQLDTDGAGRQAKPIYNLFVEKAMKLNPRFLTMIIPSRWFAGGMGLDNFREMMKTDKHVRKIVDYTNAKDCFPSNSVSGGVCYFLWDRDNAGECEFTNIMNGEESTATRSLDEFPVLVRYNRAIDMLHKIASKKERGLAEITSGLMPFGLSTSYRGQSVKDSAHPYALHASNGITYVGKNEFSKGAEYVGKYKVLISKTSAEHAGEPGKDGMFRIIPSSMKVIGPMDICTHSYFVLGQFDDKKTAENALSYMQTRFVRFLMLLSMSGFGLSKQVLGFVPIQDFSRPWTDKDLYAKYDITAEEVELIESMIRSIEEV
ncbi:Eco57I restriction-modification methylase domain-containing protein [Blautia sp. HCP28S3_G10]|uniref:Eco57I restriction-modification methylase domain-containing protein n=1 Tax=Blautia sp. HCP28S3_G10 TaxID=3438908 RepID=UPI003F887BF1